MKNIGLRPEAGSACNKVKVGGTTVLIGNPEIKAEKPHTIIKFPGGNLEIARTSDDQYWVHVSVHQNFAEPDSTPGKVVAARIDFDGRYGNDANRVLREEIAKGDVTHIAFLISPGTEQAG